MAPAVQRLRPGPVCPTCNYVMPYVHGPWQCNACAYIANAMAQAAPHAGTANCASYAQAAQKAWRAAHRIALRQRLAVLRGVYARRQAAKVAVR